MTEEVKFYEKMWFMWLMLFTVTPVGIFLMWKYDRYDKTPKIVISCVFGFIFLVVAAGSYSDTSIKTDTNKTQSAAKVNKKSSFMVTPTPSPAPLTKEEALEIDKNLYSTTLKSEKITIELQNGINALANSNGSELALYELAKKAYNDQLSLGKNLYYKSDFGAHRDYTDACGKYNSASRGICSDFMRYLEKHNVKDLSKAKEALTERLPTLVNNIAITRLKFLKENGFSEEEIQDIIKSTQ